jgi:hypothetical protein
MNTAAILTLPYKRAKYQDKKIGDVLKGMLRVL